MTRKTSRKIESKKPEKIKDPVFDPDNENIENNDPNDSLDPVDPDINGGELSSGSPGIPHYDLGLRDWFLKNQLEDKSYKVSLYRFINPQFGDRKALVNQYEDLMPSEHEIGLQFGSGRYCVFVTMTDSNGKRRIYNSKFRISEDYDKRKNVPTVNDTMGTGFDSAFNLIAKVLTLFQPILAQNNNNNGSNIRDLLLENYKSTNDILKRSALDNTQFYNDMQRKNMEIPEVFETTEETTGLTGFISQVVPLIEKFLPIIMGKSNTETKAALSLIRTLPAFGEVTKDKAKLNFLIKFIDKNHGADITDRVLKKLGIGRI
jgi:hypothetical protein